MKDLLASFKAIVEANRITCKFCHKPKSERRTLLANNTRLVTVCNHCGYVLSPEFVFDEEPGRYV